MILNTVRFGQIDFNESDEITFNNGLPGFENLKKYVLVKNSNTDITIDWLQSIDQPETALPLVNPFEIRQDYNFEIDENTMVSLDIKDISEVAVYSVAVIPEKITKMTTNLKAPIIINTENKKGQQMIINDQNYSTRHYILDEMLSCVFKTSEDGK